MTRDLGFVVVVVVVVVVSYVEAETGNGMLG